MIVGAGVFFAIRRFRFWDRHPFVVMFVAIVAPVIAYLIARSATDAKGVRVENRDPDDAPESLEVADGNPNPYRAGVRRVLLAAAPKVSGSVTAAVVCLSMLASAILLPVGLHLPRWIEAELVLAAWWVVLAVTLSIMLARGFRLRDDYVYFLPWDRPKSPKATAKSSSSSSSTSGCSDGCSLDVDGEGALAVLAVAAALILAFGAAWVLVELALPLVFFLMYALIMRAIRRVSRDSHDCVGNWMRSLGWGAWWATMYLFPLVLVTWLVHLRQK